jgi:Uncharacterised nucleotidyltransferase
MTAAPNLPATLSWLTALQAPKQCVAWDVNHWSFVLRLSRRLKLMARLGESIFAADLQGRLPPPVWRSLRAEMQFSQARTRAVAWTIDRVGVALDGASCPRVLLKGAAYMGQGLAIGRGRLPSDADILVPQASIADAQSLLEAAGWTEAQLDAHDRRYYHAWSHEVPPMRHPVHPVELDLHHNILPPLGRVQVDAGLLFARLQPSQWPGWQVLHPHDQVLHSAAHLFFDVELRDRVRDLVDLDSLLRHFGDLPGFWPTLPERAAQTCLAEPLALALHFCQAWLNTPVPAATRAAVDALAPVALRSAWLRPALAAVLTPTGPDDDPDPRHAVSAQLLFVRYHLGRLPLRLLLPHLWHKLRKPGSTADPAAAAVERQ